MQVTAYQLAERFIGTREMPGPQSTPLVLAMLQLDQHWPAYDEVAWCSAFVNFVAWLLGLPRSKSLGARTWLKVGAPTALPDAQIGFDVVVLQRGNTPQPAADVTDAPGHVGFFAGLDGPRVLLLGGNQGNAVSIAPFPQARVLGVRRLREE